MFKKRIGCDESFPFFSKCTTFTFGSEFRYTVLNLQQFIIGSINIIKFALMMYTKRYNIILKKLTRPILTNECNIKLFLNYMLP